MGAVFGDDFDVKVCGRVVIWVRDDGEVGDAVDVAGAKVEGSPVSDSGAGGSPNAAVSLGDASVVDIVLGGGGFSLPVVVVILVDYGERLGGAGLDNGRDDHIFGAGIIGSADGNDVIELGDDVSGAGAPSAEGGKVLVCAVEFTILAEEAAYGFTSCGLISGPLSF